MGVLQRLRRKIGPAGFISGVLFIILGGSVLEPKFPNDSPKKEVAFLRIVPQVSFCCTAHAKKSKKKDDCTAGQCLGDSDCGCDWKCRKAAGAKPGDTGTCGP